MQMFDKSFVKFCNFLFVSTIIERFSDKNNYCAWCITYNILHLQNIMINSKSHMNADGFCLYEWICTYTKSRENKIEFSGNSRNGCGHRRLLTDDLLLRSYIFLLSALTSLLKWVIDDFWAQMGYWPGVVVNGSYDGFFCMKTEKSITWCTCKWF